MPLSSKVTKIVSAFGSAPADPTYASVTASWNASSERTTSGIRMRFDEHFIKTGRIGRDIGKVLGQSEGARISADYDAITVFDASAVADLIADVETFVEALETLLKAA